MTPSRSLPARPSLAFLRKQAGKLARDIAAGDAAAIARARAHLPAADLPLSRRNAQFVLAREYGFAGWQDPTADVSRRLGNDLEWAAAEARRVIHDNDVARLKQLLVGYPALLSWQADDGDGGLLAMATSSYGDSFDPERERHFTRAACAELLIDAGAVMAPAVLDGLIQSRARGLLELFARQERLPRTLRFLSALGDLDAFRTALDQQGHDLAVVNDAFMIACRFEHEAVAVSLLARAIALDPELGTRIDRGVGFQVGLVERATLRDREAFITALLDLNPALLRHRPPPQSKALEFAFTYAKPHLIPVLTRIWPLPDDLPPAAAVGDLSRVEQWLAATTTPGQQALDTALAWAVINRHFEVADFLLAHGADINTTWSSHEPASLLHELVSQTNYDSMRSSLAGST